MRINKSSISLSVLALATLGDPVHAQAQAPLPSFAGEVQQLTLTGRGDVDGLVLKDGTEVKTPPSLSTQMAAGIKPGDRVTIEGLHAAALPLVQAVSITNTTSHRTMTDTDAMPPVAPRPGARPEPRPDPRRAAPTTAADFTGRVRMPLHGPQGELNGVLMENGATWRFPPDQSERLSALVLPRQSLIARGTAVTSPLGTAVEVQQIGTSREQLVTVGPPTADAPRPDAGAPPPPRPGDPRARPPGPPAGPLAPPAPPAPPAPQAPPAIGPA